MNKEDYIEFFPDACVQKFEYKMVMSHKEIERRAIAIARGMQTGLVAFQQRGRWLIMITSYSLYYSLQQIVIGSKIRDIFGNLHTVTSEPFYIFGECCIRSDFKGSDAPREMAFFDLSQIYNEEVYDETAD